MTVLRAVYQPPQQLTVLGISRSGVAAAQLARHVGVASVLISDSRPLEAIEPDLLQRLEGFTVEIEAGGHTHHTIEHADHVVLSPGIPPHAGIIQQLQQAGKTLLSEVDWAWLNAPPSLRWVGITGTNGKTTVTELITWLLTQQGHVAVKCGNIGIPVAEVIHQVLHEEISGQAVLVTELSSYQLATSHHFRAEVGVFTNLQPDHLDWHQTMDRYTQAKASLFTGPRAPEWVVLNAADPISTDWASQTSAQVISYQTALHSVLPNTIQALQPDEQGVLTMDGQSLRLEAFPLKGIHNRENLLASLGALLALNLLDVEKTQSALATFPGVEHRLETVATLDDVLYINDSKATNPEASRLALEALASQGLITLLAGGKDKGVDLYDWAETATHLAQNVILYGSAQSVLKDALQKAGHPCLHIVNTLEDALNLARQITVPKGIVLLSPACASFDQFRDFEHRGEVFKAWVQQALAAPSEVLSR